MAEAMTLETSCCEGQMSLRKTGWPDWSLPMGSRVEVVIDAAGEGVGDDQRRRHEVVGANFGVDAAFEVAIAGEDADGDERVGFDGFGDVFGQRAGVADAGGAAVADGVEAELVEVLGEAGFVVVVGDDAGAGSERGFDPGRNAEALFDGFFGQQAGGDHDGGIGGVGAAGDGGDDDGAVVEIGLDVNAEALFYGVGDVAVAVGFACCVR